MSDSNTIFPYIQPQATVGAASKEYKEVKWDFEKGIPVFENGAPVYVTGAEAALSWAYCALKTERFKHEIFTHAYGNEINTLIGKGYQRSVKEAEVKRYITECLTQNPYITGVDVDFTLVSGDKVVTTVDINTIYGRAKLNTEL